MEQFASRNKEETKYWFFKNALRKHFIGTYANIDYFSVNM